VRVETVNVEGGESLVIGVSEQSLKGTRVVVETVMVVGVPSQWSVEVGVGVSMDEQSSVLVLRKVVVEPTQ
jgi:hypothetical protein